MTKKQRIRLITRWAGGGVDPEAVYASLESIRKSGRLTADRVIAAAADPDHPLHGAFEWDDAKAAHEYRLAQARQLVRAVAIQPSDEKEEPRRVYVHVPPATPADDGFYERTEIVAKSVDMFQAALTAALADVRAAQQRVSDLRRHAGDDESRVAVIAIVTQALAAAEAAIGRLH